MALVVDTLSVAAGNTAKDKRAKEASNRSQARGPIIRKTRLNSGTFLIIFQQIGIRAFILIFSNIINKKIIFCSVAWI